MKIQNAGMYGVHDGPSNENRIMVVVGEVMGAAGPSIKTVPICDINTVVVEKREILHVVHVTDVSLVKIHPDVDKTYVACKTNQQDASILFLQPNGSSLTSLQEKYLNKDAVIQSDGALVPLDISEYHLYRIIGNIDTLHNTYGVNRALIHEILPYKPSEQMGIINNLSGKSSVELPSNEGTFTRTGLDAANEAALELVNDSAQLMEDISKKDSDAFIETLQHQLNVVQSAFHRLSVDIEEDSVHNVLSLLSQFDTTVMDAGVTTKYYTEKGVTFNILYLTAYAFHAESDIIITTNKAFENAYGKPISEFKHARFGLNFYTLISDVDQVDDQGVTIPKGTLLKSVKFVKPMRSS